MIDIVYRQCGQKETVIFCDRIMALGFREAFKAGISFGKDDMVVPETKPKIIETTTALAKEYEQQYNDGLITQGREIQQGRRRLGEVLRQARRGDDGSYLVGAEGRARPRQADQLDLYDEPLGCARLAGRR